MNLYSDYVYYQGTNNPVAGVAVSVYLHNTLTPATLYTSAGVALPTNIVTTGQDGFFSFYITAGQYDLYLLGAKYQTISVNTISTVPEPLVVQNLTAATSISSPLYTGDMTNVPPLRTKTMTAVPNGTTALDVVPNGVGGSTTVNVYSASDRLNSSVGTIIADVDSFSIISDYTGSAKLNPIFIVMGILGRIMTFFTSGRIGLGSTTDDGVGKVQIESTTPAADLKQAGLHLVTVDQTTGATLTNTSSGILNEISSNVAKAGGAVLYAINNVINLGASFARAGGAVSGLANTILFTNTTGSVPNCFGVNNSIQTAAGGTVLASTGTNCTITHNGLGNNVYGHRSTLILNAGSSLNTGAFGVQNGITISGTVTSVYGNSNTITVSATASMSGGVQQLNNTTVFSNTNPIDSYYGTRLFVSGTGQFNTGSGFFDGMTNPTNVTTGGTYIAFQTGLNDDPTKTIRAFYAFGTAISQFNGPVNTPNMPVYADNAAAIAGGLTVGTQYRTSTGVLMVRF